MCMEEGCVNVYKSVSMCGRVCVNVCGRGVCECVWKSVCGRVSVNVYIIVCGCVWKRVCECVYRSVWMCVEECV